MVKKTKYDKKISEIKSQIKDIDLDWDRKHALEEDLGKQLKILRNKQLLDSGLLAECTWRYESSYQNRNKTCVTLVAATTYWRDLEEATGESSYHWNHTIVKGELMASGDDGKIALHFKRDCLDKWVKKLGLKLAVNDLNRQIEELDGEIADLNVRKNAIIHLIELVGEKVTGIDEDRYSMCPCWISPSDPEGTVGSCEGNGGDCRYSRAEGKYQECEYFASQCKRCGDKTCKFNKDENG